VINAASRLFALLKILSDIAKVYAASVMCLFLASTNGIKIPSECTGAYRMVGALSRESSWPWLSYVMASCNRVELMLVLVSSTRRPIRDSPGEGRKTPIAGL
jgi:hypothetical protein